MPYGDKQPHLREGSIRAEDVEEEEEEDDGNEHPDEEFCGEGTEIDKDIVAQVGVENGGRLK
eukprot:1211038-Alexandrium_andersonii.AAC.1